MASLQKRAGLTNAELVLSGVSAIVMMPPLQIGSSPVAGSRGPAGSHRDDGPAVDGPGAELGEDAVDVGEIDVTDRSADLAFRGKGERLGEVLAAADDRSAQGDALQDDVEDRCREVAGR